MNNKMNTWTIDELLQIINNVPSANETHKLATLELCKRTSPTLYKKALREYIEQVS